MRSSLPAALLVLMALSWGCGYDLTELAPEELAALGSPIVNGQMDPGHPAVGMLTSQGSGVCTATLVGTRTVLTAAHCVVNGFSLAPQLGWSPDGISPPIPAAQVVYHPSYSQTAGGMNGDVAVVRLAQEVSGITPQLVAKTPPQTGETITLVGFGYTADGAAGTFGTKRKATNTIGKVTATEIVFYGAAGGVGNICNGDSGGPAFAMRDGQEVLVGIHSWGESACGVAEHDARADIHYSWVEQQAQGNLQQPSPKDLQPPKIQIVSPAPQAQVKSSFQVQVAAQDDVGVTMVELYVDGKLSASTKQTPYAFQVTGLAPGAHNLRAEALDQAGQRSSTLVSVTVAAEGDSPDPSPSPAPQPPGSPPQPPDGNPQLPGVPPGAPTDGPQLLGSCSIGGPTAVSPWPQLLPLLALLLVLVGGRRRRS